MTPAPCLGAQQLRQCVLVRCTASSRPCKGGIATPARHVAIVARPFGERRRLCAASARGLVKAAALRNIDWPEALLFDCDGVLVDTEAEGHRVAFNEAFKRKGGPWGREAVGTIVTPDHSLLTDGKEVRTRHAVPHDAKKGQERPAC
jgi:hypothetical protein